MNTHTAFKAWWKYQPTVNIEEIVEQAFEAGADYGWETGYAQAEEDNSAAIREYNNG